MNDFSIAKRRGETPTPLERYLTRLITYMYPAPHGVFFFRNGRTVPVYTTPQDNQLKTMSHVPLGPPRTRLIAAPINTPPAVCVPARGAARGVSDGFQPLLDLIVNGGLWGARAATLHTRACTRTLKRRGWRVQQRIWPMPI